MKKLISFSLAAILLLTLVIGILPANTFAVELIQPTTRDYTIKVGVYNSSEDKILGTVGTISMTEEDHRNLTNADAAELLEGSAYEAEATADNVHSVFKSGTDIIVYLKSVSNDDDDQTNEPAQPTMRQYTIKVGIFNSSADQILGTVGTISMTDEDHQNLTNADAAELLEGSAYEADATASNVYSVFKSGTDIIVYLKSVSTSNGGSTTTPPSGNVAETLKLFVNVGGGYYLNVYEGQTYASVLAGREPARQDQTFLGWKSENLGRMINNNDQIEDDDTVTAMWSNPIKYTLTLIDERGSDPDVVKTKQVAFGSAIGTLPAPAARKGYVFVGWKLNGKMIDEDTIYRWDGDTTAYASWKLESDTEGETMNNGVHTQDGKVYLEIYTNGNTNELTKRVNITSYADDNKITRSEVETVVKKYIVAKTGYNLKYEGLFDEETWWNYTRDPETKGEAHIVVNRDGDDYIFVMVKNVKKAIADPTLPKTGDNSNIVLVTSLMALSGACLIGIGVFAFGKKKKSHK